MLNQKLTWSTLQLITLLHHFVWQRLKFPPKIKRQQRFSVKKNDVRKIFEEHFKDWFDSFSHGCYEFYFCIFFLIKVLHLSFEKKIVVSTLEKPQRSSSLNLYCATWNSHFDFHCLKDKMHMQIFFCHFEKACTEKQTVLSSFFCLQRPTEKFLWRNVESTICNTLQWWCHNKGTCTGRGGVEINDLKVSYICLYMCVSHQH